MMRAPPALFVSTLIAASTCTLVNGSGFEECRTDLECGGSRICVERYCLPTPSDCRRASGGFGAQNPIRLAALLPLTDPDGGSIDQSEVAGLNALELAIEDVNESGGIESRLFSLYVCNTRTQDEVLERQVEWAVNQLGVPAVFTSGSGQTVRATEVPARLDAGVLVMSASSTSEELIGVYQRRGSPWRVAPPDPLQVGVMSRVIGDDAELAQARRVAIVYEKGTYGFGLASGLRQRLSADAGRTVDIFEYAGRGAASTREVQALQAFHGSSLPPRLTVFVGFPPDIRTVVASARATPTLSYASGHRWFFSDSAKDPSILSPMTSSELSGSLGTAPAQGVGAAFDDFRSRYRRRFEIDPNDFSFTSHSYDAAYLVMYGAAWAAREGGPITGARMSEGLTKVSAASGQVFRVRADTWRNASAQLLAGRAINVEGASGNLDFDLDAGAPPSPYEVWRVGDGGVLTTVRLVNP